MVDNYSVPSQHLDHCQRGRNCVISKNDVGSSTPSCYNDILPGKSHFYGKATVMDKETVGDVMWSWKEHEHSASRKSDAQMYEHINKDAVVHGAVGNAQQLAAFRKGRSSPDVAPPPKSRPARARPIAGIQSRPHSPFTGVIANRPGGDMEAETAARYAEYAQQNAKRRQPLRGKSTRSAQLKKTGARSNAETREHSGSWAMSRFKNVPSHFEQDRALGKAVSVPDLPRHHCSPQPKLPVEAVTSSAVRAAESRQPASSGSATCGTHQSVPSGASLKWPPKSSSAAEPVTSSASHAGTGSKLYSELSSEVPSEFPSELQSRVPASFVSGTMISGTLHASSIVRSRMSQSSMAIPGIADTSLCSSSFVGHSAPTSSVMGRKSRAASAPARRSEPSGGSRSSAPGRPATANPRVKSTVASEQQTTTRSRRPASSNPQARPERSASVGAKGAVGSAAPTMKVAELDASFVSDLWARHRPGMRGREVADSLRSRPHSAAA